MLCKPIMTKHCMTIGKPLQLQQQLDKAEKGLGVAHAYDKVGMVYDAQGYFYESLQCYKKSQNIKDKHYQNQLNHPDKAKTLDHIGNAHAHQDDYPKAMEVWATSLKMKQTYYTENNQPNHPDIAQSWDLLGSGHRHLKQYKD